MRTLIVRDIMRITLGRQGENEALRIVWPDIVEKYARLYGNGVFSLAVKRMGDVAPYPVSITIDGSSVVWIPSNADTEMVGAGACELTYVVDNAVAKSQTWVTEVLPSITGEGETEPPKPYQSWVDEVLKAGAAAEAAASNPAYIGENGNWYTWDAAQKAYADSGVRAKGQDGHTPEITAEKTGTTSTLKVDGTVVAEIEDGLPGKNGLPGEDGAPGFSPAAKVSKSGTKTTIEITDKDGTTSATVEDGKSAAEPLVVEFSVNVSGGGKKYFCNHTYSEIAQARDDGHPIIALIPADSSTEKVRTSTYRFVSGFPNRVDFYAEIRGEDLDVEKVILLCALVMESGSAQVIETDMQPGIGTLGIVKGVPGDLAGYRYTSAEPNVDYMLPVPITKEDNGKFMRVVNGVWAAESIANAEGRAF